MIRLILSDLDGTLIDKEGNITQRDVDAIHKLKDKGIEFGIITGRDYSFCTRLIEKHNFENCDFIGNNGASIWVQGKKIEETYLDYDGAKEIVDYLSKFLDELNPFICNDQGDFFFMKNHYESIQKWEEVKTSLNYLNNFAKEDLYDYLLQKKEPIVKVSIHTYTQEATNKWLAILQKKFKDRYVVLPTAFDYIEFTPKGVHKGSAVLKLLSHLKLSEDEVIVIGDGLNDISMFECIKQSYAMSHADEEVKNKARYIVKDVAQVIDFVI